MKDFDALEKLLYSHSDNRIIPGLERISRLLSRMDNPQNSFRSVHIVGTNGKGSTGAFISSVLTASGYRTGFYSSPHLASPGERLLADGEEMPADSWVDAVSYAVSHIMPGEDLPSYFELLTAGAFELARRTGIEAGVIEAGLGGKLDATNTMSRTACSVITSVSIDHTEYLGPTLEGIAGEKFAVVRENVPAVFSGYDESLVPMFRETCREKGALPFVVSQQARTENVKVTAEGNTFDFYAPGLELGSIRTGLIGGYQVRNAAVALSAISLIRGSFPRITEDSIREGMLNARWPGRLEVVSKNPLIILDGGHNLDGVKNLCASVRELWPERKFAVVYAAMRDKDYPGCLEVMSETLRPRLYATCVPGMARSASPEELLRAAGNFAWGNAPEGFMSPSEAISRAVDDGNDAVLVCGSLYMIGYIKRGNLLWSMRP
ncbi:MAG: bifunctional folylpolyglutamate synthase/dihydrofolate synthase [Synergistaceae bacterium]|nr:bifunctional folylpolyglutamate synthase/dihydrofolate synthase [Synergistaceae bacterium]